jgi:Putative mono-oxygenase ydhR
MKNAESVLLVKFKSTLSAEELMNRCNEDLNAFRNVPGLIQKYYIGEEATGAISGFYIFESKSDREAFWASELAKNIPARYGVIRETLRVEQYNMAIVLNEAVAA